MRRFGSLIFGIGNILFFPLFVLLILSISSPASAVTTPYDSWNYRRTLYFNNTESTEDLVNFPVLVRLASQNFDFSKAQNDGVDIRFIDADEKTELSYEVENWDVNNKTASIWVKVPQIDKQSRDDHIFMYWGNNQAGDKQNKNGAWDSNFKLVQHLHEGGTTTYDSSSNSNNGTKVSATSPLTTVGKIDSGQSFNGTSDFIDSVGTVSTFSFMQNTGVFTISAWIKLADATADEMYSIAGNSPSRSAIKGFHFSWENRTGVGTKQLRLGLTKGTGGVEMINSLSPSNIITDTNWHHVAAVGNGSTVTFYVDGVGFTGSNTMNSKSSGDSNKVLNIGRTNDTGSIFKYFNGVIDEVTISNSIRSSHWIKASYKVANGSFINPEPVGYGSGAFNFKKSWTSSELFSGNKLLSFLKSIRGEGSATVYSVIFNVGKENETLLASNIPSTGSESNHALGNDTSSVGTSNPFHETDRFVASYFNEADNDPANDEISIAIRGTRNYQRHVQFTNDDGSTTTRDETVQSWPPGQGKYTLTIRAFDAMGNYTDTNQEFFVDLNPDTSQLLNPQNIPLTTDWFPIQINTIAASPTIISTTNSSTAPENTYYTNTTDPTFSGIAFAGATVTAVVEDINHRLVSYTTIVDADSRWSLTIPSLLTPAIVSFSVSDGSRYNELPAFTLTTLTSKITEAHRV